jgi:diguanylate cyclase (GGDEF)-like protein
MRTGLTAPRVTPLVTLTFWWSDVTTRVLNEEADRLGVDDFSGLHDRYGLDSRNAVLSELGSRLSAGARPGDLVTRVGEDEFAVLFENLIGPSEAERRADVLRASAAAPFSAAGTRVRITVSVGVATVRRPGKHAEEVVAHAILSMNRAKRAGGNQVAVIEIDRGRPVVVADRSIVAAGQPGDHRARPG